MSETKNDYSSAKEYYIKQQVKVIQWTGDNLEEIKKFVKPFQVDALTNKTTLFLYVDLDDDSSCEIIRLGDFILAGYNRGEFFTIVREKWFNENLANKLLKDDLINNLIMSVVPKHIWHCIKSLENYGFLLKGKNSITLERDTVIMYYNNQYCVYFNIDEKSVEFGLFKKGETFDTFERVVKIKVKNNDWHEAFNRLVNIFPDSIKENCK